MKVSILTAVYNAAPYLPACLDSLLSQTMPDLQIICINDASQDDSLRILQTYAARDPRITIINKTVNEGQAKARNEGLKIATGDFITMVDSDDWLAPDAIGKALEAIQRTPQADCAVFRLMLFYEDRNGLTVPYPCRGTRPVMSGSEAFRLSLDWSLHGLYLVRASIHHAYPFDDSSRLYSDDNTTRLHYLHSRRVVLSDGQYFYRKHPASMTNRCSILRFDYMDANLSMRNQLLTEARLPRNQTLDWDSILRLYENHRWLNLIACWRYYEHHRRRFMPSEQTAIRHRFAAMLPTIDASLISLRLKLKPWYYPFRTFAPFLRAQRLYALLRPLFPRRGNKQSS